MVVIVTRPKQKCDAAATMAFGARRPTDRNILRAGVMVFRKQVAELLHRPPCGLCAKQRRALPLLRGCQHSHLHCIQELELLGVLLPCQEELFRGATELLQVPAVALCCTPGITPPGMPASAVQAKACQALRVCPGLMLLCSKMLTSAAVRHASILVKRGS